MKARSAVYLGLGSEFVGLVAACFYIGNLIDQKFGTRGFGVIGGVFVAMVAWTAHFIYVVRTSGAEPVDNDDESRDTPSV